MAQLGCRECLNYQENCESADGLVHKCTLLIVTFTDVQNEAGKPPIYPTKTAKAKPSGKATVFHNSGKDRLMQSSSEEEDGN